MKTLTQKIHEASSVELHIDGLDIRVLIEKLKDAFCEEMNAWYQYIIVAPFLKGNERTAVVADYLENAKEELENHGYWLLERINILGGDFKGIESPDTWNKVATHKYIIPRGEDIYGSLQQMIDAERGAIETYTALEEYTRNKDVVTNTKMKEILGDEQKHLQEMLEFLQDLGYSQGIGNIPDVTTYDAINQMDADKQL